jgi:hypothetical protein
MVRAAFQSCDSNAAASEWTDGYGTTACADGDATCFAANHAAGPGGDVGHDAFGADHAHNNNASIEHVAYHLAWMIYRRYTQANVTVEIVAHSMGALVVRYALYAVERQLAGFPPQLAVENVVSLSGPHRGAGDVFGTLENLACDIASNQQCAEMLPSSDVLKTLNSDPSGQAPMSGTTDWTLVCSIWDSVVGAASGCGGLDPTRVHRFEYGDPPAYNHSDYLHDQNTAADAQARYSNRSAAWSESVVGLPRAAELVNSALRSTDW